MSKKMLIDASHPEETRVVIVNGTRIEELDFESAQKRQLRGNLYLARVTRVEPSLQAAFVEYGGNRHGFLAFSEIHPDYYQIPYEDRMALLEAEEAENLADEEAEDEDDEPETEAEESDDSDESEASDEDEGEDDDSDNDDDIEVDTDEDEDEDVVQEQEKTADTRRKRTQRRRYKIQEVIKRGQILLIQVVKEERGNKGAAMTTYLSLAGRYCVLMPNTPRGGGISRKIANGSDRKRLKSVMSELSVPSGMGVIVRTAGAKRTKAEIKRDYDYLCRLWETIRKTTLKSIAPALIHEEGNLVKRSIRDLYNKDIDEVLVQGDEAYKTAKAFIKMLMPSHAKNVKAYKDAIPLFLRYQVESQIEDSLDAVVQLKSGGYLVIHPTEALVSIDINSGRSTRERNVERTALKTNLEAADEIARQMRLRDLAGLIVIDFIDMDENRNNRAVEKRMRDALSRDRARVQAGRISQFGLMEISRQRRRRSLLEGSTKSCPHCQGVGRERTVESSALHALRVVEETGARGKAKRVNLKVAPDVATYLFNHKREELAEIESEFGVFTEIEPTPSLIRPSYDLTITEKGSKGSKDPLAEIEKENAKSAEKAAKSKKSKSDKKKDKADEDSDHETAEESGKDEGSSKRRRRRGRRGGRNRKSDTAAPTETEAAESSSDEDEKTEEKPKTRSRRRAPKKSDADASAENESDSTAEISEETTEEKPKKRRSTTRRKAPKKPDAANADESGDKAPAEVEAEAEAPKKRTSRRKKAAPKTAKADAPADSDIKPETAEQTEEKPKPRSRSTARRKAPAKKSADETPDEPKKAEESKPATEEKPAPAAKAKAESESKENAESGSKKRGWWQGRRKSKV